ncbi:hypothetical protein C8R43DRAFT_956994 [Mycena crocata]|nr:hypothetical protein C8R43DRAFT_956994 [Mycena crocata]
MGSFSGSISCSLLLVFLCKFDFKVFPMHMPKFVSVNPQAFKFTSATVALSRLNAQCGDVALSYRFLGLSSIFPPSLGCVAFDCRLGPTPISHFVFLVSTLFKWLYVSMNIYYRGGMPIALLLYWPLYRAIGIDDPNRQISLCGADGKKRWSTGRLTVKQLPVAKARILHFFPASPCLSPSQSLRCPNTTAVSRQSVPNSKRPPVALLWFHFVPLHEESEYDGRLVAGYWTQTKSSQIEILLATAFKILFCFSAGRTLRRQPLPLADIDALLSEPSMTTLARTNLIFQAPMTLIIIVAILVSPLITVFAPSLTVRRADAVSRTLTVPTLDLTTDQVLDDFVEQTFHYGPVTNTWDRAALIALLSETPVGWPIPEGAPAILCTNLQPDQVDDGAPDGRRTVSRVFQDPPATYLLGYDTLTTSTGQAVLNFTTLDRYHNGQDLTVPTEQYTWTLAFVPFQSANANTGALINAGGAVPELSVSVVEYHDALNTSLKSFSRKLYNENGDPFGAELGVQGVRYAPGMGGPMHTFALVDALNNILAGSISRDANTGVFTTTQTRVTEVNIFEPLDSFYQGLQFPGLNVSTSITNVSQALQQLIANTTLGIISALSSTQCFVQFNTSTTSVSAVVPSTENIYVFNRTVLGATYLSVFAVLLVVTILGMFALIDNGEPSANNFSALLVATRNPKLLSVVEAVKADPTLKDGGSARLMYGKVVMPHGGVEPGFGVAGEGSVEKLHRRR